jgi:hypothetical protein
MSVHFSKGFFTSSIQSLNSIIIMNKTVMLAGIFALLYQTSCTTKKEKEVSKYTVTSPLKIDTSFTKE